MAPQITLGGSIGVPGSVSVLGFSIINMPDANVTLTPQQYAVFFLNITGAQTGEHDLILSGNVGQPWLIKNSTTGGHIIIAQDASQTSTIPISPGQTVLVYIDENGALQIFSPNVDIVDNAGNELEISATGGDADNIAALTYTDINGNIITIVNDPDSVAGQAAIIFTDDDDSDGAEIFGDSNSLTLLAGSRIILGPNFAFGPFVQIGTSGTTATIGTNNSGFLNLEGGDSSGNGASIELLDNEIDFNLSTGGTTTLRYKLLPVNVSDVTSTRSLGSVFTNSTGQNMQVTGWATTSGSSTGSLSAFVATVEIWRNENTASVGGAAVGFSFVVPPGATYEVTGSGDITGLGKWVETLY